MYVVVPQAMAQFVLKIEKLSHIMGLSPILEMARTYGLRPILKHLLNLLGITPSLIKTAYVLSFDRSVFQNVVHISFLKLFGNVI